MNRKNLTAAVLAGLAGAAGIVSTATAGHDEVFINPDGLGEVLLYPYYTVNNGNLTVLSVVNTTDHAKAVKVRFKEGENSREVLDFNLYLSRWDVWTAAIINDNGTPTLIVPDNSCTVPYLYEQDSDGDGAGEQAFLDFAYTGEEDDGGRQDIARAMEGHFEIIEMGEVFDDPEFIGAAFGGNVGEAHDNKARYEDRAYGSETAATHVDVDGVQAPLDCQQLVDQWSILSGVSGLWIKDPSHDMKDLTGGIFGSTSVVNVGKGTLYPYDATALGDFHDHGDLHVRPGNSFPSLNDGDLWSANVFFGSGGSVETLDYLRGIDAVSAVFMHDQIMNEYVLGGIAAAESEWVITFPTKAWYVDPDLLEVDIEDGKYVNDGPCPYNNDHDDDPLTPNLIGEWVVNPALADGGLLGSVGDFDDLAKPPHCDVETADLFFATDPFTSVFDGEACELAGFRIFDYNENAFFSSTRDDLPIVSPPPPDIDLPPGAVFELCYETSVLHFGDSNIFSSRNTHTVNDPADGGWAAIDFGIKADTDKDKVVDTPIHILFDALGRDNLVGLPANGFWADQFTNGDVGGLLANYGGLFNHKGSTLGCSGDCFSSE